LIRIPGVKVSFGFERGSEEGSVKLALSGPDSVTLGKLAEDVVRELEAIPELSDVKTGNAGNFDELRIAFDREEALRYGVSQEVLLSLVSWGIGSQQLSPFKRGSRDIPVLVEFEDPATGDLEYLKSLSVPVGDGGDVTLASLGRFEFAKNYGAIRRSDGIVSLTISAQSYDQNGYRVQRRVEEVLSKFPFPDGYDWRDRGNREDFEASQNEVAIGLLAGCMFVFLLMGMLFESFLLPFAVLITIPLALVGGSLSLWLTKTPIDSMAMLAFILLAGVVVNNGIVLVDRIQQLRNAGCDREEAVQRGCLERLRPVLMTALTTIFALLPMAIPEVFAASSAGGMIDYRGLAIVTVGGMILSTLLTLLVVPMFFTAFDDLWSLLVTMFARDRRPSSAPATRLDPEP
jgi:hydrophobic/amphiphilic exporter-1 (mainly G- bacteria), HAE1 family